MAKRLREARRAAGHTQEQVAQAFGISREAVALWESGKTNPDIRRLYKLAELYRVNVSDLLDDSPLTENEEIPPASATTTTKPVTGKGFDRRAKLVRLITGNLQDMREEDVRLVADMCARLSRKTGSSVDERKAGTVGEVTEHRRKTDVWEFPADALDTSDFAYMGATDYEFDSEEEAEQQRKNQK